MKKWLQMLPALKSRAPLGARSRTVSRSISLYSTTWGTPSTWHTTPTGSSGYAFSTTCSHQAQAGQWARVGLQGTEAAVKGCPTHLGATVRALAHAETNEEGVGQPHQDVVHAVDVHKFHPALLHVLQDLVVRQCTVQTPVAVCGGRR